LTDPSTRSVPMLSPTPVLDLAAFVSDAPAGSDAWWRDRLCAGLDRRSPLVEICEDYSDGRHSLAFLPSKLRSEMGAMLASCADNYMPLVLESAVERMSISAFQPLASADTDGASLAWDHWRRSDLDEYEKGLWLEASKDAEAYLLVWKEKGQDHPTITTEHPREMIVCRDSQNRNKVVAALKRWRDDSGETWANLWLPGKIYRYRKDTDGKEWGPREIDGVPAESEVPAAVGVPVVPITNNPSMTPSRPPLALTQFPHGIPDDAHVGLGRSDLSDVISTQDSLNAVIIDAHSASRYQGFRVRYAIGVEIPEDDNGDPIPLDTSAGSLWMLDYDKDKDAEPKVGDLPAADLGQFIDLVTQRIQSLSSRSRVPVHYLLSGRIQLPSGEALTAAEAGLTMKIRGKTKSFGPAAARAIQLAFAWDGDTARAESRFAAEWENYEHRTEAEHIDALGKKVSLLGIPKEATWTDAGYGNEQLPRLRQMAEDEAKMTAAAQQVMASAQFQPVPDPSGQPPTDPAAPSQAA